MSDAFDTNLLSQVTALDRKLSISKERVSLFRKSKHDEQKKHHQPPKEELPAAPGEQGGNRGSPGGGEGKIDITI
jgi:hypothetical protein